MYPPCVSNVLDQYLSEPVFAQNQCKIDAPVVGKIFYSSTYRHVRADLQISLYFIPNQ